MIRKWIPTRRAFSPGSSRETLKRNRRSFGHFEQLEQKRVLAFIGFFDGTNLSLDQTVDDGNIIVDDNGGGNEIRVTDGSGTTTFVATTNLEVNLFDNTGNQLDIDLDNAHAGDLVLNLGEGGRQVNFIGSSNDIGGELGVNSGSGVQTIELAVNNALNVVGSASFDLGLGADLVDEDSSNITIGGDLTMINVALFENNGTMSVTGNVLYDNSAGDSTGEFDNDTTMTIGGNFSYFGNDLNDNVNTNAVFNLSGDFMASVGEGGSNFNINQPGVDILGSLTLLSTDSANVDDLDMTAGLTIGGDFSVDFGGGTNNADFFGAFNGSGVTYMGGDGVDTLNYDFSGNPADVDIMLGDGVDSFTLGPNASIAPTTLDVVFGDDGDTFINNFGPFTFNANLLGLAGFDFHYDSVADSLTAMQTVLAGNVEFDNNGINNAFRVNNGQQITPASHLAVTMLDSGSTLNIDLDSALAGDLTVDLGNGNRFLNLIGFNNSIGGNLDVTGGTDSQLVELSVNANLNVGGNASFDLGVGDDEVDEDGRDISITGDLNLSGVNEFEPGGTTTVGGSVLFDASGESETSRFDNDGGMSVTGDLTYVGSEGRDEALLNGASGFTVGGNVAIDLGDNTVGGTQYAWLNAAGVVINGTLDIDSSNSNTLDDVLFLDAAQYLGDVNVDLGGGPNVAQLVGVFGGTSVKYTGGDGVDAVSYGMTGVPADVNAKLGAGDDEFTVNAGAAISPTTLRVDFGGGLDTLVNNYGAFDFNASLLNWHGYNRHYTFAEDIWNMTQVLDTGDIMIDNNGAGGAIRLVNGAVTEMTPAANVRLNLLSGSSTNVAVDLDSPLAGDLVLQLRHGARDVTFTGADNSVGGSVVMLGGDGVQNFHVSMNQNLMVGGDLVLNGRDGMDSIQLDGNDADVGNNFILRGINHFVNTSTVNVAGNFNMVTVLESQDTLLDNDGTMNIAGGVNYIGGSGVDNVLLNAGGVSVGATLYVDLADATDVFNKQNVSFAGGVFADQISVVAGDTVAGNGFLTDVGTHVAGNVIVVFTGSTTANTAIFAGTYSGTYGTYRGGSAADDVTFGAFAEDMTFVAKTEAGNDTFTLDATTDLISLLVQFGDNDDTFVDNLGEPYGFPVTIQGL